MIKTKNINIYVVGGAVNYANFIENASIVEDISTADIVLFTGGEDVDPSMYGCKKHQATYSNIERDKYEKKIFDKIKKDQIAVGICRGSQFLCVMNGGLLVQNVSGHGLFHTHTITNGFSGFDITSTHHQMQYPFTIAPENYDILYRSKNQLSYCYEGERINPDTAGIEPEIVLYHCPDKPKCLAIQGHPEYMRKDSQAVITINDIIKSLLK